MTADEIRNIPLSDYAVGDAFRASFIVSRELAAQLADLNESLERIANVFAAQFRQIASALEGLERR